MRRLAMHEITTRDWSFAEDVRRPRPQLERVREVIDRARDRRAEELLIIGPGAYQRLHCAWRLAKDLLGQVLPYAETRGVVLSIETLHLTYLPDWGFPNTIQKTFDVLDEFPSPNLGIFLDIYHVWWHQDLFELIERCRGQIHGVQLNDWCLETCHPLNDRVIPGEGTAPVRKICHSIEAAGYSGTWDIKIVSDELWATDYDDLLQRCEESFENIWR